VILSTHTAHPAVQMRATAVTAPSGIGDVAVYFGFESHAYLSWAEAAALHEVLGVVLAERPAGGS